MIAVALPPDDLIRLIKLAGLLASDQVGERAAAAAACTKFLTARNLSWAEVLTPPPPTQVVQVVQPPPGPRTWRVVADEILIGHYGALHGKELEFLPGLLARGYAPTVKQAAWLGSIARRCGVPLWDAGP